MRKFLKCFLNLGYITPITWNLTCLNIKRQAFKAQPPQISVNRHLPMAITLQYKATKKKHKKKHKKLSVISRYTVFCRACGMQQNLNETPPLMGVVAIASKLPPGQCRQSMSIACCISRRTFLNCFRANSLYNFLKVCGLLWLVVANTYKYIYTLHETN